MTRVTKILTLIKVIFFVFLVGYAHTLNKNPVYNWGCVMDGILSAATFPMQSMPPDECPKPCEEYDYCAPCLDSQGGEGGWRECVWSETKEMVLLF